MRFAIMDDNHDQSYSLFPCKLFCIYVYLDISASFMQNEIGLCWFAVVFSCRFLISLASVSAFIPKKMCQKCWWYWWWWCQLKNQMKNTWKFFSMNDVAFLLFDFSYNTKRQNDFHLYPFHLPFSWFLLFSFIRVYSLY